MSDSAAIKLRSRSPSYPAFSLKVAIEKAAMFYETQKKNAVYVDVAKKTMGYEPKSSGGIRAISTLTSFGLMNEEGSGEGRKVWLTPLAHKILFLEEQDPDRMEMIQEAALKPTIYREMLEEWPEELPNDAAIEKYLTFTKHFNREIVKLLIRDFRATYEFANLGFRGILSGEEADRYEPQEHHEASDYEDTSDFSSRRRSNGYSGTETNRKPMQREEKMIPQNSSGTQTFTLPLPGGKMATLQVPTDINEEGFNFLTQYLGLMKGAFVSKPEPPPQVVTGPAIWQTHGVDVPVEVTGYAGSKEGRHYAKIKDSDAGIPLDEIRFEATHSE